MTSPFIFMTSVEAVQLTGLKASCLSDLDEILREVDESSIYHHTHRFYRAHSFLGPADRSDFALWVGNNLKEEVVAERMGSLDLRDFRTLQDLRKALLSSLDPLRGDPVRWIRPVPPGLEFHFCRSISLILPVRYRANNLEEFLDTLAKVDVACIYFHMIEAPLHFKGSARKFTNDFSQWLAESGFPDQAQAIGDIDPYQGDLESLRERLLSVFHKGRLREAAGRLLDRLVPHPAGEAAALWLRRFREGR